MADEKKEKALTKAQKTVLEMLDAAESLADLTVTVSVLSPEERNEKRVAFPVHLATERIVNRSVPR